MTQKTLELLAEIALVVVSIIVLHKVNGIRVRKWKQRLEGRDLGDEAITFELSKFLRVVPSLAAAVFGGAPMVAAVLTKTAITQDQVTFWLGAIGVGVVWGFFLGTQGAVIVSTVDDLKWGEIRIQKKDIVSVTAEIHRAKIGRRGDNQVIEIRMNNKYHYEGLGIPRSASSGKADALLVIDTGLYRDAPERIRRVLISRYGKAAEAVGASGA